jgi:hypothetical protein
MRARPIVHPAVRLLILVPMLLGGSGCRLFGMSDSQVSFFSEPPGAKVIVDRQDSGFVTPCRLTLAHDDHGIELELPGYATAHLALEPSMDHDLILWQDMTLEFGQWRFPLWLNTKDTFSPLKLEANLHPGRVFVRLQRAVSQ